MDYYPKISIITPSFNQGQFIAETIKSVLNQNYPNLEYILIDGGSSDESVQIIEQYQSNLFYWVSEKDDGQYDAIQKGFDRSTGDIMMWINSDDMLVPNCLFAIAEIFDKFKGKVDWITGVPAFWDDQGRLFRIFQQMNYYPFLMQKGGYEGRAVYWVMQECTVWTRGLWERSGAQIDCNLDYAADFELWYRFGQFAQLYNVSMLIGANRQWGGQKTIAVDQYYEEVDQVLTKDKISFLVNKLCRNRHLRKLIRAYVISAKPRNMINYNARLKQWELIE